METEKKLCVPPNKLFQHFETELLDKWKWIKIDFFYYFSFISTPAAQLSLFFLSFHLHQHILFRPLIDKNTSLIWLYFFRIQETEGIWTMEVLFKFGVGACLSSRSRKNLCWWRWNDKKKESGWAGVVRLKKKDKKKSILIHFHLSDKSVSKCWNNLLGGTHNFFSVSIVFVMKV
jgi:hypothetical protein